VAYGVPADDAKVLTCIAKHESSYNPYAINRHGNRNHTVDRGLFQINDVNVPLCHVNSADLYDIRVNTKCAIQVYHHQGLEAWSTYHFCSEELANNK
jgi:hypothetical protein